MHLDTTINAIHFPLFQKRTLSVSTHRRAQSEWMSEKTDNAPQSVPNEADVVVIGNVPQCGNYGSHTFLTKIS